MSSARKSLPTGVATPPTRTASGGRLATFLLILLGIALPRARAAEPIPPDAFSFRDGETVLFMGDTFLEREGDLGHIETRLTILHNDRKVHFRNLSWAADTPMGRSRASFDWNKSPDDWLKRVREQVALVKPDAAILSYGLTASFAGRDGVEAYERDLVRLMDAIREASGKPVRFALLGPLGCEQIPGLDPARVAANNADIRLYVTATRDVALRNKARFVDLYPATARKRPTDPQWTTDGLHLNHSGYYMIAYQVQFGLGFRIMSHYPVDPYETVRRAVVKKNEYFFHRWRPANWTYLFGFRKHEQGQNAGEIPQFDPIIADWEARIDRVKEIFNQDPDTVQEIVRVTRNPGGDTGSDPAPKPQPVPTFDVADGFEVGLWAENPSLHKPIQMNWDPQGRLWVASSEVYPQIRPGQPATDSIVVLEDTDGDGQADKSTVFATGLLIPTGVLPDGRGGCYVGASHQLIHLKDTNGDGVSDLREIVLSSFGTEDTHHNIHTLRWGYDGHLYINQSIYTHTHIETPYGIRRLNSGGIWRFQPDTWRLEVFTRGGCNPWGHHWDQFGNSFFTDGAGFKGVYHAMPGATYFTYSDMRREAESISPGNYPKFASLEVIHSPAFPADWQGQLVTCDFRAHRIVRFGLEEVGSSFRTREMPDLLRSTNVTFRPIDVRFGPDGALYIADWSNPIIQHGEVDFRDPRRDKEHGRIWRVTRQGYAAPPRTDLTTLTPEELLDRTLSASGWEQEQSRVVLRQRGATNVLPAIPAWLERRKEPRARLEALWLHTAFGQEAPALLRELATAEDARLRTAAARQIVP